MFQSCSLSKGRFESRKYNRMTHVIMCGIFPYFRISEDILYAKELGDGMEIGSPEEKKERGAIWAPSVAMPTPSLEAHGNGTTWCVTPHERSCRPFRIGRVRLPSSPFGGDAVAFVCRRRWAPRSGFSAQALKSEIRVALRRRHADASHHALPSTGHSPRQA